MKRTNGVQAINLIKPSFFSTLRVVSGWCKPTLLNRRDILTAYILKHLSHNLCFNAYV